MYLGKQTNKSKRNTLTFHPVSTEKVVLNSYMWRGDCSLWGTQRQQWRDRLENSLLKAILASPWSSYNHHCPPLLWRALGSSLDYWCRCLQGDSWQHTSPAPRKWWTRMWTKQLTSESSLTPSVATSQGWGIAWRDYLLPILLKDWKMKSWPKESSDGKPVAQWNH